MTISIDLCPPNGGACKSTLVTNALGGAVTIDLTDLPPLQAGTYTVRTCNLTPTPITLNIRAVFGFSLNTVLPVLTDTTVAPMPILDDAVTDIYLTNNLHSIISSLDVGLLISDPRVSDLAITLHQSQRHARPAVREPGRRLRPTAWASAPSTSAW